MAREVLGDEYCNIEYVDASAASLYKIETKPSPVNTLLIVTADATTEATRRVNYFKTARTVYKFTGTAKLLALELGQSVTLIHNRFNLYNSGSGVTAQVISLAPDWVNSTVEVEVIV
jgi:hypothetical protein